MRECQIGLALPKCSFGKKTVKLLSHWISSDGLVAKPKDLNGFLALKFPGSKKGLQSFVGTLNYYSKFLQVYSSYAPILYEFDGGDFNHLVKLDRATKAFELLKKRMTDTPVLKHFDSKLP